jgi:Flp pilus assembly protein TadD
VQRDETDSDALVWHARACLANGDPEGYRRACASLLKQFDAQKEPGKAAGVARTLLLAPDAVADLAAPLNRLLANGQDAFTQTTRGGLLLRAGKHTQAIAELQKVAAQRQPGEPPVADLLLAIALHKQGKSEDARRALDQARFVQEREATVRQALTLWGAGAGGPLTAASVATLPAAVPRWDWPTQLEVRLLRQEAEAALQAK